MKRHSIPIFAALFAAFILLGSQAFGQTSPSWYQLKDRPVIATASTILNNYYSYTTSTGGGNGMNSVIVGDYTELANLNVGSFTNAFVTGYGTGMFVFNASGNPAIADGGTLIANASSTGLWVRTVTDPVQANWFGADPTDTNDSYPAIASAVAYAHNNAGSKKVMLGAGTYLVYSRIVLPSDVSLQGVGITDTKLISSQGTAGAIYQAGNTLYNTYIGDFTISTSPVATFPVCIYLQAFNGVLRDLYVYNYKSGVGILLSACHNFQIDNVTTSYVSTGIELYSCTNGSIVDCNSKNIQNNNPGINAYGAFIRFTGTCSGIDLRGCQFDGNGIGLCADQTITGIGTVRNSHFGIGRSICPTYNSPSTYRNVLFYFNGQGKFENCKLENLGEIATTPRNLVFCDNSPFPNNTDGDECDVTSGSAHPFLDVHGILVRWHQEYGPGSDYPSLPFSPQVFLPANSQYFLRCWTVPSTGYSTGNEVSREYNINYGPWNSYPMVTNVASSAYITDPNNRIDVSIYTGILYPQFKTDSGTTSFMATYEVERK
jgi:hypothetical protein